MKPLLSLLSLCLVLLPSAPAATITGGYLQIRGWDPVGTWRLESPGLHGSFSLGGGLIGRYPATAFHDGHPGDLIDVTGLSIGTSIGSGPGVPNAMINGSYHEFAIMGDINDNYTSIFTISAAPIAARLGVIEFPFTISGRISARGSRSTLPPGPNGCDLCNLPITGSGIGTLTIEEYTPFGADLPRLRTAGSTVRYDFGPLTINFGNNVPEPGSASLLMAGLVAVAWLLPSRRRN